MDIAEANPHDRDYGIGMALHDNNRTDTNKWGKNLMGNLLIKIRNELCPPQRQQQADDELLSEAVGS